MPRTILVADDEPHITLMLALKLRDAGARAVTASDGEEAILLAIQHRPDLIVTDFQMPLVSGLELATRLLEHPETAVTPLIMLTARGHLASPEHVGRTNIRCIMSKPFSVRDLIAKIVDQIGPLTDRPVAKPVGRSGLQ
jgi:two-component system phosphate regulon response regulator PhoB